MIDNLSTIDSKRLQCHLWLTNQLVFATVKCFWKVCFGWCCLGIWWNCPGRYIPSLLHCKGAPMLSARILPLGMFLKLLQARLVPTEFSKNCLRAAPACHQAEHLSCITIYREPRCRLWPKWFYLCRKPEENAVEMVGCWDWKGISTCIIRSYLLQKSGKALFQLFSYWIQKQYCIQVFIIKDISSIHGCKITQQARRLSWWCWDLTLTNLNISRDGEDKGPQGHGSLSKG